MSKITTRNTRPVHYADRMGDAVMACGVTRSALRADVTPGPFFTVDWERITCPECLAIIVPKPARIPAGLGRLGGQVLGLPGARYMAGSTTTHWFTIMYKPANPARPFTLESEVRRYDADAERVFLPARSFKTLARAERAAARLGVTA